MIDFIPRRGKLSSAHNSNTNKASEKRPISFSNRIFYLYQKLAYEKRRRINLNFPRKL